MPAAGYYTIDYSGGPEYRGTHARNSTVDEDGPERDSRSNWIAGSTRRNTAGIRAIITSTPRAARIT